MREQDIRDLSMVDAFFQKESEWLSQFVDKSGLISSEYTESVPCPCCGSNNGEDVFVKLFFQFQRCSNCSTVYVNPRFNKGILNQYYRNREDRLKYLDVLTTGENETNRIRSIFLPRMEFIRKHANLSQISLAECKLLDIGCASGQFLSCFNALLSPQLFGVEASADLSIIAKNALPHAKIFSEAFEQCVFEREFFDIITVWEVLEHIYDPALFLKLVANIIKPGGLLFLTLPNIEGFDIQILWDRGNAFSPPSHLNYFRKSSIHHLFENAGLTIKDISTPGMLDLDIVRNRINIHPDVKRRLGEYMTNLLTDDSSQSSDFIEKFQKLIQECGLSSHMMVVCSKPFL